MERTECNTTSSSPIKSQPHEAKIVVRDTIDEKAMKLLRESGYEIIHVPNLSMTGHTRKNWTIDPAAKTVLDAAPEGAEPNTFSEFISSTGAEI